MSELRRKWSIDAMEYDSLEEALAEFPAAVAGALSSARAAAYRPGLYAQLLPGDPPLDPAFAVTHDGKGRPWLEVGTIVTEVQMDADMRRLSWLFEGRKDVAPGGDRSPRATGATRTHERVTKPHENRGCGEESQMEPESRQLPEIDLAHVTTNLIPAIHLRFKPFGWATVYIDDERGTLAIESDWGTFSHRWGKGTHLHPSSLLTQALPQFLKDRWYTAGKLGSGHKKEYDAQATERAVRERLLERRRAVRIAAPLAREAWGELDRAIDWDAGPEIVVMQLDENRAICDALGMEGMNYELMERRHPSSYLVLRDQLIPALLEVLPAELASVQPPPVTPTWGAPPGDVELPTEIVLEGGTLVPTTAEDGYSFPIEYREVLPAEGWTPDVRWLCRLRDDEFTLHLAWGETPADAHASLIEWLLTSDEDHPPEVGLGHTLARWRSLAGKAIRKSTERLSLIGRLRDGLRTWARDEDGVHYMAWDAYADACVELGEPRPDPED